MQTPTRFGKVSFTFSWAKGIFGLEQMVQLVLLLKKWQASRKTYKGVIQNREKPERLSQMKKKTSSLRMSRPSQKQNQQRADVETFSSFLHGPSSEEGRGEEGC